MLILIGVILYLGVVVLTMIAAKEKYRNPVGWGFLALCIGVFAWIPLVLLGESHRGRDRAVAADDEARLQERAHELELERKAHDLVEARRDGGEQGQVS